MKNTFLKPIFIIALAMITAFTITFSVASGQEVTEEQASVSLDIPARPLGGVWRNFVSLRNCMTNVKITNFQSLLTFYEGGTMSESGGGVGAGGSPILRGPGHGIWQASNAFHPTYAFTFLRFNADGTLAGTQRIRATASLALDG